MVPQTIKLGLVEKWASETHDCYHALPYFENFYREQHGLLSYVNVNLPWKKFRLVPLDPIGENPRELIADFLAYSKLPAVFANVNLKTAEILKEHGYKINEFGTDCQLHFANFNLDGKEKRYLRRVRNYYKKGLEVREVEDPTKIWSQVQHISDEWKKNKTVREGEVRIFTRPLTKEKSAKTRHFFCYRGDEILGYVFFDPISSHGQVRGYLTSILRAKPDVRPQGVLDYIIISAYEKMKAELSPNGMLSLGLAPLARVNARADDNPVLRVLLKLLFRFGDAIYNFRELAHHKSLYRPHYEKLYICSKDVDVLSLSLGLISARSIEV